MKLAYIPAGTFTMGSPETEPGRISNETQRQVTFAKGFRIAATEVTQQEWRLVMSTSPSYFKGDDLPVERITWLEAEEFCRRLSEKEEKRYRLPTRGGMGVRMPRRHHDSLQHRREQGCAGNGGLVPGKQRQPVAAGRSQEAQPLGTVRHARQRFGVVCRAIRREIDRHDIRATRRRREGAA